MTELPPATAARDGARAPTAVRERRLPELAVDHDVAGRGLVTAAGPVPPGAVFDAPLIRSVAEAGYSAVPVLMGEGLRRADGGIARVRARAELIEAMLWANLPWPAAAVAREHDTGVRATEAVRFAVRTAAWFAPLADVIVHHALDAAVLVPALQATALAAVTAASLGLPQPDVEDVALAALVADLGMTRIPEEIRAKPGPFTPLERRIMQRHLDIGAQMLEPLRPVAPGVIEIVAHHHERADGTGYPSGQLAATIPVGAQVVAVVQRFQAAVSPRPWRVALSPHDALDLLMTMADRLAPLAVVEAFVTQTLIHPRGAAVRLSDGSSGVVVGPGAPGRPVVERRAAPDGSRIERERIDLARAATLFVDAVGPVVERPGRA